MDILKGTSPFTCHCIIILSHSSSAPVKVRFLLVGLFWHNDYIKALKTNLVLCIPVECDGENVLVIEDLWINRKISYN